MKIIKKLLKESLVYEILETMLDEEYPTSWNPEEFKTLTSFAARINYCQQHLKRISSGSSRIVYMIDNEKVLKLAKNQRGLAQNEVEISAGNDFYLTNIVAEVFSYDKNDLWLEMELARKLSPKSFETITGISWDLFTMGLQKVYADGSPKSQRVWSPRIDDNSMTKLWDTELFSNVCDYMMSYKLPVGDLCKINSYGIVKREGQNDIVMIDYGLSYSVYDSFYS